MSERLHIVGELMNNSYARARKAFRARDAEGYQELAKLQTRLGADFLTLNLDGTQMIQVRRQEMLDFLPEVVLAIQEATQTPIAFDNSSVEYHRVALKYYDRKKSDPPILNSLAASREHLDEMVELVKHYDTYAVVMASETFVPGGTSQCMNPQDAYRAAKHFVELLVTKAGRRNDQIIIDPGLAPVGADTYGLVNIGLDAMRLIHADPDLKGVHMIVGLSNFAWGTPKGVREELEKAYLTLGMDVGLDFALANPEKTPGPLPKDHPMVAKLREAGLLAPTNSTSATWADYDNDGFLDLFVCCQKQPCILYRNKGDGTFEEVTARAGLANLSPCLGAAWIDFDNDGYPDLFVNIGQGFGGRDHSTVIHSLERVSEMMKEDSVFRARVEKVRESLRHEP